MGSNEMRDDKMTEEDGGYANYMITGSGSSMKYVGLDHGKANGTQPHTGLVMDEIEMTDLQKETDDDIINDSPDVEIASVRFSQLFRFSDGKDKLLMFLGTIAAIGNGAAFPLNLLIYGRVLDIFIRHELAASVQPPSQAYNNSSIYSSPAATFSMTLPAPPESVWPQVQPLIGYFCLVGVGVLVLGYAEIAFWTWTAERQSRRIRTLFFHSILKQHIGWFDTHQSSELNTRLSDDIAKISSGIGDKLATLIQWLSTFLAGYIIGFTQNYKLTLVILSVAPLLVLTLIFMAKMVRKMTIAERSAYAKAGAVAEETLANIRTVAAFGAENKETQRYDSNLEGARNVGVRKGFVAGVGQGMFWICIFGAFGLAFWYGSRLVITENVPGGNILQVFMGVMVGTMSLGHAAPNLEYISSARGAAAAVFGIIDLESDIDSSSNEGETPENMDGEIDVEGVDFSYPARPEIQVLRRFTVKVRNGQTVALVGESGCGKSTVMQLLQRFYDPDAGQVKVGGYDVRDLNVRWLRQNIGVVSQEPVLFATTIAENIGYGKEGVSLSQIKEAAKQANALDFIQKLPQKFNTLVGARGAQLSGGQKQRIAIARALVANPKILLLDEATSALDTESERVVQDALDKARQGRTMIIIAHRLSTVRNANLIVGMSDGKVVELGTHHQLMQTTGIYRSLVESQMAKEKEENAELEHFDIVDPLLVPREGMSRSASVRSFSRQDSKPHVLMRAGGRHGRGRGESVLSEVSDIWSAKDEIELNEKIPPAPIKRILQMNAPEWPYILIGCLSALITGSVHPTFSILFSEILGNFANPDHDEQNRTASIFSALIASLGLIVAVANLSQQYFFSLSGENLTLRLRKLAFACMLRQDITWFDDRKNQVGALTARLAMDASAVRGAAGQQLGVIVQSSVAMSLAIIIAFVFAWKLAGVVIAFLPFLIFSGVVQGKLLQSYSKDDRHLQEEGGKIAVEAIDNIRTVAALTQEHSFEREFNLHFDKMYWQGVKKAHIYGIFYSFGQCVVFFAYAATFAYGSQLIDTGYMKYREVFRVFAAITFGGQAVGRAGSFAPDLTKAKIAAGKLFMLFDRTPLIDSASNDGMQPDLCAGRVDFQSVRFHYPSRPEIEVLQRLNFSVQPGQTLALVGSSGCGKSTTVQLVERFYDPVHGKVRLDGRCVKELNVSWLRSRLGMVSQEPILFDATIRDNIAYGDNSRDVPMADIIKAARDANIHNFIQALPQGYDTNVGEKGAQLSGGQKQRVAIARALVRNPKVLLLDEATSALDTENELVVQEALDKARMGRTCITIAHRLSTIRNADIIAVMHNGRVVEQGSHVQLMQRKGYYYKLQQAQQRAYRQS